MDKIQIFAELVEKNQIEHLRQQQLDCQANLNNCKTKIKPGKKYVKVDVGSSGKFMIDADENIFGIKAYGVIHRGKRYGTLDTINEYFWGRYAPVKLPVT